MGRDPGPQFHLPARVNSAGPFAIRTMVASTSTATLRAKPRILIRTKSPRVKAANTTIMIAAALVIRPPVRASPSAIAFCFGDSRDQEDLVIHAEAEHHTEHDYRNCRKISAQRFGKTQ